MAVNDKRSNKTEENEFEPILLEEDGPGDTLLVGLPENYSDEDEEQMSERLRKFLGAEGKEPEDVEVAFYSTGADR